MRYMAAVLMMLVGCWTTEPDPWPSPPTIVDISGAWSYEWQVSDCPCPGTWDGRFHGVALLEQTNVAVIGTLEYPVEGPETMFNEPGMRAWWHWPLAGVTDAVTWEIEARPENSQRWLFVLDVATMEGPAYPVTSAGMEDRGWRIKLSR